MYPSGYAGGFMHPVALPHPKGHAHLEYDPEAVSADQSTLIYHAFDYIHDEKTRYTPEEAAKELSYISRREITADDIREKSGNKELLTDQDMLKLLDQNRDGLVGRFEIEQFTRHGPASGGFKYLKDNSFTYNPDQTAEALQAKTGVTLTADQIKSVFDSEEISDSDMLYRLDGASPLQNGRADGVITRDEVLNAVYGTGFIGAPFPYPRPPYIYPMMAGAMAEMQPRGAFGPNMPQMNQTPPPWMQNGPGFPMMSLSFGPFFPQPFGQGQNGMNNFAPGPLQGVSFGNIRY